MALSPSSSVDSASAAPPKMSTEFSRPRRPKRRCSIPRPFLRFPAILLLFQPHAQRNHLERSHFEAHGIVMHLYHSLGFFEEVDALHALDVAGETQHAFPARAVGLVEAQDRTFP